MYVKGFSTPAAASSCKGAQGAPRAWVRCGLIEDRMLLSRMYCHSQGRVKIRVGWLLLAGPDLGGKHPEEPPPEDAPGEKHSRKVLLEGRVVDGPVVVGRE